MPCWHLAEAAEVARAFPDTPIVLNHTGFPWDRSEAGLAAWRKAMEVIARCAQRASEGLGIRPEGPALGLRRRTAASCATRIAIFGIERCMFATNFPVAGLRVDYDTLVRAVQRMIE